MSSINDDISQESQEILKENYIDPLDIEGTNEILKQMQTSICKICAEKTIFATGFFCNIIHEKIKIPVLMTNNHVINEEYIKKNKKIILMINNGKFNRKIEIDKDRLYYSSLKYDTTIIELFPEKDNIKYFLDLEDNIINDYSDYEYRNISIYLMHYPKDKKLSVSYGILKDINERELKHYCFTDKGSSGY